MVLRALILDFNSFFASVEQALRPELRGRPVAVVPLLAETTCCIAASTEAKACGVKTGTRVADARRMCPGLRVVEARPAVYIAMHHRLAAVVETCTHVERALSVDEFLCLLTGPQRERENALALARDIKRALLADAGPWVRCSIGLAPNAFLAKTASDLQKPDGLVVIEPGDLPDILFPLALRDLCGIGPRLEPRLHACGIRTVEQLCRAPKALLRAAWGGLEGERMHALLRGEPCDRPETARHTVVGHSRVLPPEFRHPAGARSVLHRLLQKAALRLRAMDHFTAALSIGVLRTDHTVWHGERRFLETQDTLELLHALDLIWRARPRTDSAAPPLKVGVHLFDLRAAGTVTRRFFENPARAALCAATDALNARFGKNAVYFAGAHAARDQSSLRIAFHHVPDPRLENDLEDPPPDAPVP